jgi:hypothetical protein
MELGSYTTIQQPHPKWDLRLEKLGCRPLPEKGTLSRDHRERENLPRTQANK